MKQNSALFLALIVIAAVAAGLFIYPKFLGNKWRPWRLGLDLVGGSHLVYDVDLSKVATGDQDSVLNGLRDVIEKRVNNFGVSEPQIYVAKGNNTAELIVELAGVKNISDAIAQIGETPLLDFREVVQNNGSSTPPGVPQNLCVTADLGGGTTCFLPTNLTGRYIKGAQLNFDQTTRAPQVTFSLNEEGAKIFEQLTEKDVGKAIAVFLDNNLVEVATVREKISNGQAVISGKFTITEAQQLVERFNAGALPAPITLVNQQTVSPSLGANSLKTGILAGIIGTILVMIFMIIYYRLLGVFASLALLIYIVLTLAVFKLVPITLTLAGLAGFILTIGMAVDANILTFERVKEESKRGLPRHTALEEGFRRAWPSIRDSNASTMITAVILYFFTSSFVRGFALTLFLGVVMSMFSAITTTRLLLRVFLKNKGRISS